GPGVRRPRPDARAVRGPRLQGPQAAPDRLRGGEVPRPLVLHRRPRPGEQGDAGAGAPAQPAGLQAAAPGRADPDLAGGALSWPRASLRRGPVPAGPGSSAGCAPCRSGPGWSIGGGNPPFRVSLPGGLRIPSIASTAPSNLADLISVVLGGRPP